MGALLHSLHAHEPLPAWAPAPAAQPAHTFTPAPIAAPTIGQQRAVKFMGHLFFVTWDSDEDGAWIERVQVSGAWWDAEEVLSLHMRNALGEALTELLIDDAKEHP